MWLLIDSPYIWKFQGREENLRKYFFQKKKIAHKSHRIKFLGSRGGYHYQLLMWLENPSYLEIPRKIGEPPKLFLWEKICPLYFFLKFLTIQTRKKKHKLGFFQTTQKKNTSLVSFLEASFLQHRFCLYFELYAQKLHISFMLLFFIFPNNILAHLCQVSQNAPHFSPCNNLIILTVRV